jgi:hypothetical protein
VEVLVLLIDCYLDHCYCYDDHVQLMMWRVLVDESQWMVLMLYVLQWIAYDLWQMMDVQQWMTMMHHRLDESLRNLDGQLHVTMTMRMVLLMVVMN